MCLGLCRLDLSWDTLSAPAGNLQLCLSIHFLLAQSFSRSGRGEEVSDEGLHRSFLATWTSLNRCVASQVPGMLWSFSETPMDILFPGFSFMFLVSLLLALTGDTTWGTYSVNCCWLFSTNALETGQSKLGIWSPKDKPWKWRFSRSCQTDQTLQFSEDQALRGTKPHVLSGGCSAAGWHSYHSCKATGFQGFWSWEGHEISITVSPWIVASLR